jgi:hypothetical protein
MNRRGVEFTLIQVQPGLWKWKFQIGEIITTGGTQSSLMGIAARRAQQQIDRELGKSRDLPSYGVRTGSQKAVDSELQEAHNLETEKPALTRVFFSSKEAAPARR